MSQVKISEFIEVTQPAIGDCLPILDISDVSQAIAGSTRKIKYANLVPASIVVTPTGSNDNVVVQAAVNATGIVFLRKGSYSFSNSVSLLSNTQIIMEEGVVITQIISGKAIFSATGSSGNEKVGIVIKGGSLITPTSGAGGTCIAFNFVDSSLIEGVAMSGGTLACISLTNSDSNIIQRCKMTGSILHGMRVTSSTYNTIKKNYIYDLTIGQGLYLFDGSSDHNTIEDNRLTNIGEAGIRIEGSHNEILKNHISGCGRHGVYEAIFGSTRPVGGNTRNTIEGNHITNVNTQNGGHVGIWVQHNLSVIRGNIVYNTGTYDSVTDGIVVNALGCVVSNNHVQRMQIGIVVSHYDNVVTNNDVRYCYRNGISLTAAVSGSNFNLLCTFNTVSGNVVKNCGLFDRTYAGILISASGASTIGRRNIITGNVASDDQDGKTTTISSSAASGQKVVPIASIIPTNGTTSQVQGENFVAGMWVTITNGVNTEINQIASVDSATQLTMTTNLANTYATGSVTGLQSQKYGVQFRTASGGSVDKNIVSSNILYNNITAATEVSSDSNVQTSVNITT